MLEVRGTGQALNLHRVRRGSSARRKDVKEYTGKKSGKRERRKCLETKNILSSNMEMPETEIKERGIMKPEDFKVCSIYRAAQICAELLSGGTM